MTHVTAKGNAVITGLDSYLGPCWRPGKQQGTGVSWFPGCEQGTADPASHLGSTVELAMVAWASKRQTSGNEDGRAGPTPCLLLH